MPISPVNLLWLFDPHDLQFTVRSFQADYQPSVPQHDAMRVESLTIYESVCIAVSALAFSPTPNAFQVTTI